MDYNALYKSIQIRKIISFKGRVFLRLSYKSLSRYFTVFQVEVLWVVTMCSVIAGWCLHLQGEERGNMDLRNLMSYNNTTRHHNTEDLNLKYDRLESLKTALLKVMSS
jgi:hypothetical protein